MGVLDRSYLSDIWHLIVEMAKAQYTIFVPNSARHVGIAAHHYLTSGPIKGIGAATLQFGHPHDSLNVIGEETPEMDSHMKQTGTFVGDVANAPHIDVIKRGKGAPAHWTMRNPHYQPEPAGGAPLALQQHPAPSPLPSVGQRL